jgi:hypothetical protein
MKSNRVLVTETEIIEVLIVRVTVQIVVAAKVAAVVISVT